MKLINDERCRVIRNSFAFVVAALVSGAALAHVFPKTQEPGAGTTVVSPPQVRITFDGPLEPSFSSLTVTDAAGKQVNVETAKVDSEQPAVIAVALPALPAGHYTVHWTAVADDGHRTHGDYSFNVKR
jgi:methionine-rich copper-binding protein CopC